MEASERNAPGIVHGQFLDRPSDLLPQTSDAWTDGQLRDRTSNDHHDAGDLTTAPGPAASLHDLEGQYQYSCRHAGEKHWRQNSSDHRPRERARWQHSEQRWRDGDAQQARCAQPEREHTDLDDG